MTGTGTSVGKTLFCAYLVRVLDGFYWKPIQCGEPSDVSRVRALSGLDGSRCCASAYSFVAARSPHEAAAMEGETIHLEHLRCPKKTPLVVEGAGGVLVPINDTKLMVDMMAQLGLSVVVVASSRLGTINHTLLTLEALRRRNLEVYGVVLCGPRDDANAQAIQTYGRVKVVCTLVIEGWVESLEDDGLTIIDKGRWEV
ncbi:MAG: dethiobiotin synthase [Alphaproteobacteria bacterium GM202ARS2]|nr:dethiobiotin synthase [Alphaproteobacteria bacterium GM202ARS2]